MGRGGNRGYKQQQWRSDYEGSQAPGYGKYYKYWEGSWSVSPKSQAQPSQGARYDATPSTSRRPAAPWKEMFHPPPQETSVMVAVQKALTATRKADVRMRKLREEREHKQQAWQEFLDTKRKELATQKKNFDADLLRIDKDMESTAESGSMAATRVQELVLKGAVALQQPVEAVSSTGEEWDALIAEATASEPGFFQAALMATRSMAASHVELPVRRETLHSGEAAAPAFSTPDRTTSALPRTPLPSDILQRPAQEVSRLRTDEMPGPSDGHPPAEASPITPSVANALQRMSVNEKHHPGQRDASKPRCMTSQEPPRPNIKDATKTTVPADTGGMPLADKLEQKREALRTGGAMTPFGVPLRGPVNQDTGQKQDEAATVDLEMGLIFVLVTAPLGSTSPLCRGDVQFVLREHLATFFEVFHCTGTFEDCASTWQSVNVAVKIPRDAVFPLPGHYGVFYSGDSSLEDLRASIHALLKDAFRGAMNRAAPLIPQLHNSCAQFVAYPSILDADGSLGVAVIFDLSRVGGAVFASVVARVLQETDLIPFVRSLTRADVEEYAFYIGSFVSPVAAGEHVTLTHGTVITVVPAHSGPPHDFAVTDLLRRDGPWSQIQHMPRLSLLLKDPLLISRRLVTLLVPLPAALQQVLQGRDLPEVALLLPEERSALLPTMGPCLVLPESPLLHSKTLRFNFRPMKASFPRNTSKPSSQIGPGTLLTPLVVHLKQGLRTLISFYKHLTLEMVQPSLLTLTSSCSGESELVVIRRLNRESLCATAGLSSGPDVQVFVQGMPWALGAWQLVDLATGSTVTFLRRGQAAPQRHILEDMLFDSDPWNAQTAVPAPRGQHYLLLTEGIPQLFTLEAEGRLGYRDLIAQQLQFLEQNMTLQGTRPRLDDVVHCGHHPYAVVVATEAICLLPVPPARLSPPKWILVLDLRDILLPFSWRFLACDTIPVQEILREFDPCRPDGFVVSVTGAPIEHWPSGPVFRIRTGQVLSVSFVADDLDDSSDPGHGQDGAIPSLDHASGSDSDTEMHEAPEDLHDRHNNAEGDHGVRRVHDEPHSPVSSFGPVTVTVGFGILVPGFSIERIMLEIEIPTTIAAVTALLQQTRNADVARDFPGLLPALIQPDPRWGLFLALPIWGSGHNTICIDMFATRQTVFAVPAPSVADRGLLLEHAGLPSAADFDVYVDSEELVLAHSVIELQSGSTICLVPPGDQRPWTMQLSAMLTTHLPWDASEPYPSEPDIDRYCLACADGLRVFPILPDRAHLYREDIAARLQCPSRLLQLVPANPKPNDVAFFGFLCRNVLAALDRSAMRADDRATFGLLDARRIYKGWLPLVATDGWLDVAALLEQLAADLPSGWHVSITNLVLEQMHVYLEEGAVLTVAAQRDQERGYTAAPAPPASHSTSSGWQAFEPPGRVLETLGGFTTSSVQHIKGHAGHPYNELVDTLAGAIGVADSHVPEFLHPLCAWATQGTITWLWLTVAALRQPAIWPRSQGNTLFDPHGNSTIDVSALSSANFFGEQLSDTPEAHKDDQVMWFQARFVSINVQSLGEDDSSSLPNRVPFVREQLSYVGCIVAALQETRAKCTSTVVSATHVRFLSARDQKGCFGVELWFARTVPYAWQGQQPLFFEAEDFRVLSWTPRQLFVRFAKGPLRIVFAACHVDFGQAGLDYFAAVTAVQEICDTAPQADARWLRHFSSIERGGPVEQADLPSKFDLEHAMRQAAREYQNGCFRVGLCSAIVFLDLREAFHRVARPLVHGGDLSDSHLAQVLHQLQLPPARMDDLRAYVRRSSLLVDSGASEWAADIIKEFQADSWLTIGTGLAAVEDGTRPGDALADVVFSFLFAAVLRRIREAIQAAGVDVHLPWSEEWFRTLCDDGQQPTCQVAPVDVSWMDDLALLLTATSPEKIVESVRTAATILTDECIRALLRPNLDRGKTEALVSFVGKGAQKVRSAIFRSSDPSISLSSDLWPDARLRLVPKYRHLGGILHWRGSLDPEIRHRTAQGLAGKPGEKIKRGGSGQCAVTAQTMRLVCRDGADDATTQWTTIECTECAAMAQTTGRFLDEFPSRWAPGAVTRGSFVD
ncbi:hypothetical protein AK812_SmicGene8458 [Symbiodinium microadriaticum]|uniref:Uncharacterized protein n=1 Tax=Symbiodinium microadriaticum TaxID=2951 RepID=A0A1Q9EKX6_SYMMI|nr:hypothetical protein AK812_SmicGene8458 [Symbiodinium microadriaticum]